MHTRVRLSLIAAALGIVVASPGVLAAPSTGPAPSAPPGDSTGISCEPLATQCTVSAGSTGSSGGSGSGGTTTVTCSWQGPLTALTTEDETLLLEQYGDWHTSTSTDPDYYIVTCTPVLDDEVGEWLAEVWPQPPVAPTPGQVAQTAESAAESPRSHRLHGPIRREGHRLLGELAVDRPSRVDADHQERHRRWHHGHRYRHPRFSSLGHG